MDAHQPRDGQPDHHVGDGRVRRAADGAATRDDVEKALGRPTKPDAASYETEKERVHIIYSTVPCEEGVAGAWNVPPDTVIRIEVTPQKELRENGLGLEESAYTKVEQPYVGGAITYVNEGEGILIKTSYLN